MNQDHVVTLTSWQNNYVNFAFTGGAGHTSLSRSTPILVMWEHFVTPGKTSQMESAMATHRQLLALETTLSEYTSHSIGCLSLDLDHFISADLFMENCIRFHCHQISSSYM